MYIRLLDRPDAAEFVRLRLEALTASPMPSPESRKTPSRGRLRA